MHATIFGNVTAIVQRMYGARKSVYQGGDSIEVTPGSPPGGHLAVLKFVIQRCEKLCLHV